MPGWRRGSSSRASARPPGGFQRPARGRFAGPRSRPPIRPGGRPTPSTSTTADSPPATAPTRRSLGRAQAADLLLAHALARPGLSTHPINDCRGKLLTLSGRLTVPHGIETPRQLPGTILRRERRKRNELDSPHWERGEGGDVAGLDSETSIKEKAECSGARRSVTDDVLALARLSVEPGDVPATVGHAALDPEVVVAAVRRLPVSLLLRPSTVKPSSSSRFRLRYESRC